MLGQALSSSSRWLLRTIQLSYVSQFSRQPPKFRGILFTSVGGENAAVLRAEVATLLRKGAVESVPQAAKMKKGFFTPYFIVPKKMAD